MNIEFQLSFIGWKEGFIFIYIILNSSPASDFYLFPVDDVRGAAKHERRASVVDITENKQNATFAFNPSR